MSRSAPYLAPVVIAAVIASNAVAQTGAPTASSPATSASAASTASAAPAPASPAPTTAPAAAGPSTEARAMAETLFFAARGLMEAGRLVEACQKFDESYRLDAAAGTLLNLAVCHEKIGKIASAWGEFRQALFDAKKAGREDREALAKEHLDVLEPELPYLTIHVPASVRVPGLEVVRNGAPLQQGGWDVELPVDPGTVLIETRASGYKPKKQTIEIAKRQHLEITVEKLELAPVPVVVVTEPGMSTRRKVGIGLIGFGVVGLGVGGYFGYRTFDAKNKSDDACPVYDDERRCSAAGTSFMKSANRDAWISNISIGVGLTSLVVGTYLYATGGNKDVTPPAKTGRRIDWTVAAGPNGISGVLFGAF